MLALERIYKGISIIGKLEKYGVTAAAAERLRKIESPSSEKVERNPSLSSNSSTGWQLWQVNSVTRMTNKSVINHTSFLMVFSNEAQLGSIGRGRARERQYYQQQFLGSNNPLSEKEWMRL